MVGRGHGRRGDGRPSRRHLPLPHRLRRRRGRVPRGRGARAARADVPEPPADARVRGSGRADEADADNALRYDRGARHDDAVRRRGRSEGRLRARGRAAAAATARRVSRRRCDHTTSVASRPETRTRSVPSGSTPRRKYRGRHEGRGKECGRSRLGQAQVRFVTGVVGDREGGPLNRWRHDEHGHEDGHAVACAARCRQPRSDPRAGRARGLCPVWNRWQALDSCQAQPHPRSSSGSASHLADARFGENARVPAYTLNQDAVRHAKRLIDAHQYVLRSRWQDVQPRARQQNAFLKTHSWEEYAAWHLGLTEGAAEETKAHYAFVYGDLRRLHRMGLIACHYRAAEWRHKEIELAAHELLQYLDQESA